MALGDAVGFEVDVGVAPAVGFAVVLAPGVAEGVVPAGGVPVVGGAWGVGVWEVEVDGVFVGGVFEGGVFEGGEVAPLVVPPFGGAVLGAVPLDSFVWEDSDCDESEGRPVSCDPSAEDWWSDTGSVVEPLPLDAGGSLGGDGVADEW